MSKSIEEAEALQVSINRALDELRRGRPFSCQESEVGFRFDALIGMLTIAQNDAKVLIGVWEGTIENPHCLTPAAPDRARCCPVCGEVMDLVVLCPTCNLV